MWNTCPRQELGHVNPAPGFLLAQHPQGRSGIRGEMPSMPVLRRHIEAVSGISQAYQFVLAFRHLGAGFFRLNAHHQVGFTLTITIYFFPYEFQEVSNLKPTAMRLKSLLLP
ncbi:hypothetical protein AXF42_Ash015757 [Apostasia shenzhenica]|uniref:Uncharacterized protein n=1 Tax=Apostasia shenzhenica TaxID=1088818 RepID=A0A2H9ZU97_9ASPA|nr:hypothetical protein AXF42_Ash015757 [Apostasia shenzhenica]